MREPSDATQFPAIPALPPGAFPEPFRPTVEAFNLALAEWYDRINGRISLGNTRDTWSGHVDGETITIVVPQSNVDFAVVHNLERMPLGFLTLEANSASPLHRLESTPANSERLLWMRTAAAAGSRFLIWVV